MTLSELRDSIAPVVADFDRRRVLVLGDAILDEYLLGDCSRISPEAPVPVLRVSRARRVLGGAANTAANIVSLGGCATLVALVGQDEGGRTLVDCARQAGVDLRAIDHGRATLRKTRVVSQQQQIVRLDYEEIHPATPAVEAAILSAVDEGIGACDVVVISDYAKGFLSPALAHAIVERAHRAGLPIVADPRPQNKSCYAGCDYLTPNWREARALLNLPDAEPVAGNVASVARALAHALATNVVLTLGPHGILFCSADAAEMFSLPTLAREVFDVSGAGDTVVAAFALARAAGADHRTAVTLANKAASVVVGKFGTATVTAAEMLEETNTARLVSRQALAPLAATLRAADCVVLLVNHQSLDLDYIRRCAPRLVDACNAIPCIPTSDVSVDTVVPSARKEGEHCVSF